ncbi:hypothetical protein BUALT_Bualt12G0025600 [Buddleja alternifolia]|uniref:Uncharacterized protein n=1 Tax=Buddleja alternifolia TaxID=168488 RepID=A0AAV6WNI4_9LAMI|nr:hypothetical protein BUALT_Bualt12G0025600 [Buddleja alternifolia]
MAGLQYKFFPTDFLFPPPPATARDGSSHHQLAVVKLRKADEIDDPKAIAAVTKKSLKATSSSSVALAPIHKHN